MKKVLVMALVTFGLVNHLNIVGYLPPGNYRDTWKDSDGYQDEWCMHSSFVVESQTLKGECRGWWGNQYNTREKSYCFVYNMEKGGDGKETGNFVCDLSWIKETPQATMEHLLKNFTKEDLTNQRRSLLYQALLRPKYKEMLALLTQNGLGLKKEDTNLLEDALVQAARQKNKEVIEFLLSQGAKGTTALLSAQHEKNTEMVQFLQQKGIKMPVIPGSKPFGKK